jgi:hypothetical protein
VAAVVGVLRSAAKEKAKVSKKVKAKVTARVSLGRARPLFLVFVPLFVFLPDLISLFLLCVCSAQPTSGNAARAAPAKPVVSKVNNAPKKILRTGR